MEYWYANTEQFNNMMQTDVTIINKLGLHARAAAKFVTLASGFESEIQLVKDDRAVNGKSIMGIMMLAAGKGTKLKIIAEGSDENMAVDKLRDLVESRFGENE
jgi:phosphocarrier protein HPr